MRDANGRGGVAAFPNTVPNNAIWISGGTNAITLAHELGHYFGLFHTHLNIYTGSNGIGSPPQCFLRPPSVDIDLVPDTPYDAGPTGFCPTECPVQTTPCTLTCDQSGGSLTYTYSNYLTNNLMSYHSCPNMQFTQGQIQNMFINLTSHASRTFLLSPPSFCNNEIAEQGFINKYCNPEQMVVDVAPIKDIRVHTLNETTGFQKRSNSFLDGHFEFFGNRYANNSMVTLSPDKSHPFLLIEPTSVPANYQPLNGLTTFDIYAIQKEILGISPPLNGPYARIAADANNSGTVTAFDIVLLKKVLLGIDLDFEAGTWRFVPEFYFLDNAFAANFAANPFSATYAGLGYADYMDNISLDVDNDLVANSLTWSFRAIKVGDVNCSMDINEASPSPGNNLITISPNAQNCIADGDIITVDINGASNSMMAAYQLGIKIDTTDLKFIGISAGDLPGFSHDNFYFEDDQIKAIWLKNDGQAENIITPKKFFKIHFEALNAFCNIQEGLEISNLVIHNSLFDQSGAEIPANINFEYQVVPPIGKLLSVTPNPATTSVSFNFQLSTTTALLHESGPTCIRV